MREKWARVIALLTGGLVATLAVVFAFSQNPRDRESLSPQPASAPAPSGDAALIESGRRVYAEQDCAGCHAIAGRGNPRSPLDGVGSRLNAAQIRRWIAPAAEGAAPSDRFQAQHANRDLTEAQRAALVAYLLSLRNAARAPAGSSD